MLTKIKIKIKIKWRLIYFFLIGLVLCYVIYYRLIGVPRPAEICESIKIQLVDSIFSCNHFDEIKQNLINTKTPFELVENRNTRNSIFRPAFKRQVLKLRNTTLISHEGVLYLYFVNGYLSSLVFYPKNYSLFSKIIKKHIASLPYVKEIDIFYGKSLTKQRYIRIEDDRLEQFVRLWVRRFA